MIIDLVLSHTSDQHPWFQASRANHTNLQADWYVWADARSDGTPPNNWLSVFGGPSWQWEPRRGQYYLHNFLASQPDLNYHCAAVQAAVLAETEFWLARGVDGCRLDVANYYFHDRLLRDNPPRHQAERPADGVPEISPYGRQHHRFDKSQPETLEFLGRLRRLFDRFPGTMTVAEVHDDDSVARAAEYVAGQGRLHTAYSFALFAERLEPALIRAAVEGFAAQPGDGWPSWSFSNHDVARAVSRWGGADAPPACAKLLIALLATLRGTAFLYQGEELGLPQAEIPFERLQDPFGRALWPVFPGRDGCRTPMPWQAAALNGGFSAAEPWLPLPESHLSRAVSVQENDPDSVLAFTRRFLAWRRCQPVLIGGTLQFLDAEPPLLVFERTTPDQRRCCRFNLSPEPAGGLPGWGWSIEGYQPATGGSP